VNNGQGMSLRVRLPEILLAGHMHALYQRQFCVNNHQ